jgi:hypothetical protein
MTSRTLPQSTTSPKAIVVNMMAWRSSMAVVYILSARCCCLSLRLPLYQGMPVLRAMLPHCHCEQQ